MKTDCCPGGDKVNESYDATTVAIILTRRVFRSTQTQEPQTRPAHGGERPLCHPEIRHGL